MKTKAVILISIILLVGFLAIYFVTAMGEKSTQMPRAALQTTQTVPSAKNDSEMMEENSRYVVYTPEAYEKTSDSKRVLFFYANWCPTCRPADVAFKQNADKIPQNVTLLRVNYNDTDTDEQEKALADQYGITYQHTFVQIDKNGEVISKWNGGALSELLNNIN